MFHFFKWIVAKFRQCLEIVDIPPTVDDNSLEEKVIQAFEKVGCNIDFSSVEACHRITKRDYREVF